MIKDCGVFSVVYLVCVQAMSSQGQRCTLDLQNHKIVLYQ